jgi:hypothetical protein
LGLLKKTRFKKKQVSEFGPKPLTRTTPEGMQRTQQTSNHITLSSVEIVLASM